MKVYLGFDDTDTLDSNFGTGKLVRWFQKAMPKGYCDIRRIIVLCPLRCPIHPVRPPAQELHDSMEQPARLRAQSGRFLAKSSLSGCSS